MRTLPTGSVDTNFGRRVRNRRQLNSLQNTWPYGYSMPIAVRYTQDFFFQAEDCIRVRNVTGVQTCALPIFTLDAIPVFVRGGSIVFRQPVVQHTGEMAGQALRLLVGGEGAAEGSEYEDDGHTLAHDRGVLDRKSGV